MNSVMINKGFSRVQTPSSCTKFGWRICGRRNGKRKKKTGSACVYGWIELSAHLFHHIGLLEKVFRVHRIFFESFHSHFSVVFGPNAFVNLKEKSKRTIKGNLLANVNSGCI